MADSKKPKDNNILLDLKRKSSNFIEIENQLISWLNDIGLSEKSSKVELLHKVNEVMINQLPHLIPQYMDNVLAFAADRNQEIRKLIINFIQSVSKKAPEYISRMIGHLNLLLRDEAVAVQKRVIQAASIIYKQALIWFTKTPDPNPTMRNVWEQLNEMKVHILDMVDSDNEGIRTNSIKFLESIILLQTVPDESLEKKSDEFSIENLPTNLSFLSTKKLEEESDHIFNLLIKFHNSQHISSVNLTVCSTALCSIGKLRPKFMPLTIQAIADLISSLPPTLSQSQVNSVKKHLKMQLINLIKHPSSSEVQPHILQLLLDVGMTPQEIVKAVPREKRNKRLHEIKNSDIFAKRIRIDSPQSNSQGSDKSDNSSQHDIIMDDLDQKMLFTTEKILLDSLHNVNNVVELIISTMSALPNEMPLEFVRNYKPITGPGTLLQKKALAKLLNSLIKGETVAPSVAEVATKIPLLKDDDETTLKNAIAKLAKTEKPFDGNTSKFVVQDRSKSDEGDKVKHIPPQTPTVPKLKQRVKLLKLQEITKSVPKTMKEKLMLMAVERIIKCDKESFLGGEIQFRNKLLVSLASTYNNQIRETVLEYILQDIISRFELAIQWLFEEYSYVQGFNRQPLTLNPLKSNERTDINYNNLFCSFITNICENTDPAQELVREKLLYRIYLESPMITDDAVEYLKHIAGNEDTAVLSLNLLEKLVMLRPTKTAKYVSPLLQHTGNNLVIVRETALQCVMRIYKTAEVESIKRSIEKHATLYLGFLALTEPPQNLYSHMEGKTKLTMVWTDDLYKICINLYLTLLPMNEGMIMELAQQYANIGADAKRCVLRALETPIRMLAHGMSTAASWDHPSGNVSPVFLKLIEECPKGAETLITRIVHILTERAPPSPELVSRVRELYTSRVSDVRFLIPVLNGLSKDEIFAALPKLIKLNPVVMREVFNKLLGLQSNMDEYYPLPVTPSELLFELHVIDQSKAELKYLIKATSLCFAEKQAYTEEVLAIVIQNLMELNEIPVLLMRTVLQVLTLYPKLSGFALNVLQRLISKEVWLNKVAWEGWIRCCERLLPASLAALASLPAASLQSALAASSSLAVAVTHPPPSARLPGSSIQYLQTNLPAVMPDYQPPPDMTAMTRVDQGAPFDPPIEPLPPGMD